MNRQYAHGGGIHYRRAHDLKNNVNLRDLIQLRAVVSQDKACNLEDSPSQRSAGVIRCAGKEPITLDMHRLLKLGPLGTRAKR